MLNEDPVQALEDLNKALSITRDNDSKVFIYATRGMVRLLQNKDVDAQNDFEESIRLSGDKIYIVPSYLESLKNRIMQIRQHRALQQKSIV